jgi:hypothetical protein
VPDEPATPAETTTQLVIQYDEVLGMRLYPAGYAWL